MPGVSEFVEWVGLLKSCCAFEAYCRHYTADVRPQRIAEFLVLNPGFPRSIHFAVARVQQGLPMGLAVHAVSDQPRVVQESVHEFKKSLAEAVAIVLVVSFFSLGLRTGLVVALSIPLVLALTFLAMWMLGIELQRISLGALIIALGLLVDDAIIAVEMMALKLEQGWDRFRAATHAYTATAFPMLTGTLITAAGFLPVGFAKSGSGEYV